ncbi:MAG TPA: adenylate/guanylate cyclase domain-containing protein [Nitrososphaeraceae archaeon]|nr:adenylate/guanylate cyclase domain-containing protein [Nitrososphaeraceae archaeon]
MINHTSLIYANFFFTDIVGLSDPRMSTKTQIKKIEVLNKFIREWTPFKTMSNDSLIVLPTGDGMAIGFFQSPELPLNLAIELHRKIGLYNKAKIPTEALRLRIGIHSGPVFVVNDVLENKNVWGPGIIIARRVMDIGNDGHILLSSRVAEDLRELSDEYKKIIKPLHDYTLKHGQRILIYSAYGSDFGNPNMPLGKTFQRSKMKKEIVKLRRTTIYPYLEVNVTIKDPTIMRLKYKRLYEIENISDEPIYQVLHGIATDIPKTFEELNIKVYDNENQNLIISSISVDKPFQKEFTTVFNRPILKEEKGKFYVLEYEVEEPDRYFENTFLVDCHEFIINFDYPITMVPPIVYDTSLESHEKKYCDKQPVVIEINKERATARWKRMNIFQGQSFRFEWK